ncbi:hypothetical protein LZ017_16985 [Pelomonas sp. CA6]|uniref:hypothetical protein n=1 Tax=Pelomonas sp. CA6 TaxID=2907999 RepID=UPI001F4C4C26|nr:hypothetical protein [Pelomonas sp. CA6]MCH7345080.1 hypothetical protein [Pelomonas sp. CA6]
MTALAVLGLPAVSSAGAPGVDGTGASARAGYGVSLADIGGFEQALRRAEMRGAGATDTPAAARMAPVSEVAAQIMKPFDHINAEAERLGRLAESARLAGSEMRPGDVVHLTLRCQEFMFHCQLTSNIANRGSDGLQQLFRQQG